MKIAAAVLIFLTVVSYICQALNVKCVQGDDGTAAAQECSSPKFNNCYQPKFNLYTGLSSGSYGCGECLSSDLLGNRCESCKASSFKACNTPKETGYNFTCYDWEWNLGDQKFVKKETKTVCQTLKETPQVCNIPTSQANVLTKILNKGCGPCEDVEKTFGSCRECHPIACDSAISSATTHAVKMTAFQVPVLLLAIVYSFGHKRF